MYTHADASHLGVLDCDVAAAGLGVRGCPTSSFCTPVDGVGNVLVGRFVTGGTRHAVTQTGERFVPFTRPG